MANHGDKHNPMHNVVHGVQRGGWTKDTGSNKGIPQSSAEWVSVMAAAGIASGGPSLLWKCQDTSGNTADSIGTFTGTASGTGISYANPVAGWGSKSINFTDAGTGTFTNSDAGLPDISVTSALVLAYINYPVAPGTTRSVISLGTTVVDAEITVTPRNRQVCGANNVQGTLDPTGQVRPIFVRVNRTASNSVLYTNQEIVTPTFGATATGKRLKLGGAGAASPNMACLYLVMFFGAAAELSNAQIKTLGNTLGWTMP